MTESLEETSPSGEVKYQRVFRYTIEIRVDADDPGLSAEELAHLHGKDPLLLKLRAAALLAYNHTRLDRAAIRGEIAGPLITYAGERWIANLPKTDTDEGGEHTLFSADGTPMSLDEVKAFGKDFE